MQKEFNAKVLIIGETKVGKTSILTRYTEGQFQESLVPTVGIDFRLKRLELNGITVKMQIWDTAGQERFRSITQGFYRGAMGIILVFDMTDSSSFRTLENWLSSIKQHSTQNVQKILLGNKNDLESAIENDEIERLAQQHEVKFFSTSAKTGENIDEAFDALAKAIMQTFYTPYAPQDTQATSGATLTQEENQSKSSCC